MPALILAALVLLAAPDTYPRNSTLDMRNYAFHLVLGDDTDSIRGSAAITFRVVSLPAHDLRLDLVGAADGKGMIVSEVLLDGVPVAYIHEDDALTIRLPAGLDVDDEPVVEVTYSGIPATGMKIGPNKHGDRTFFSDNWPNRARHWLPTVDHPYDKATSEFIVDAPARYQVVSNGLLVEETDLGDGMRRTHWRNGVPIATWLYALGVAEFAVQRVGTFDGKEIQTWVYRQDRDAGFHDFAVPTEQVLRYYSDTVGPFAYEKLANIQSNSVGGGMEAASSIFYGDNSVTGERDVRWRNVIIHELAHQWFGNAVTESDWDDVWLSEGFATYFTLLFREYAYGRDDFVAGLKEARQRVWSFYQDHPDYRLVHDNLDDMSQVTTSQIYQRGAWVLHMLRSRLGDEAFWRGIRSYYSEYFNANATTADFRRHMERASGEDLEAFFEQWLYQGGHVVLDGSWRWTGSAVEIELGQVQDYGYSFNVPVEIGIYAVGAGTPTVRTFQMGTSRVTVSFDLDARPEQVVIDPRTVLLAEWTFVERD